MGLDCSHGAFRGAYSAFNSLRQAVCHAIGGSFPPHWKYDANGGLAKDLTGRVVYDTELDPKGFYYPDGHNQEKWAGLHIFLAHSDCDGEIAPEMCSKVADDLERVLPEVEALGWEARGHLAKLGYAGTLRRFIAGCRAAAEAGEPLEFH